MVTEIYNDIDDYYMDIDDWILFGITDDAVRICIKVFKEQTGKNFNLFIIRNRTNFIYDTLVKPLNRW